MNYRVENNVIPINGRKAEEQNAENRSTYLNIFSRGCEKQYKNAIEIWCEDEDKNYEDFIDDMPGLLMTITMLMNHQPNAYTKEEHWRLIYLISLSNEYLSEKLVIDIREKYLMDRMMEAEKNPMEFIVNNRVISYPYSIYLALGAYHMTLGDEIEGKLWLDYGEDRIKSFISEKPERVQSRTKLMFDIARMCFSKDGYAANYEPFIVNERKAIFKFNRWISL